MDNQGSWNTFCLASTWSQAFWSRFSKNNSQGSLSLPHLTERVDSRAYQMLMVMLFLLVEIGTGAVSLLKLGSKLCSQHICLLKLIS